ncbi:hypothetical protein C2E20_6613 [Micractinium conductrix]|uniref:Uncharacterized protein n=1 Tax=Micractinium conductrix TaxID=554055 RepID=A0A2P6V6Y6_9CHLO|nr:hypothetical protein C2E20_6613 [Micractinium conductrix]|eukprot:PSC69853.1 hypothetical protein C2E20_6613 [Micractinium conductrix]
MAAAPAHAPACVSQSVGTPIALREPPSGLRWRELGPLLATAAAAASPAPSSAATHFAGSLGSADLHPNSSTSSGGSDGGATASTPRRQHTACLEHLLRTPVAPVLRPQASLQSERDAASGTPRPGCYRLGTPLSSPAALSLRYVHGTPEGTPRCHPPGVLSPWPAATLALSPRPMHTMQPCSVRLTGSVRLVGDRILPLTGPKAPDGNQAATPTRSTTVPSPKPPLASPARAPAGGPLASQPSVDVMRRELSFADMLAHAAPPKAAPPPAPAALRLAGASATPPPAGLTLAAEMMLTPRKRPHKSTAPARAPTGVDSGQSDGEAAEAPPSDTADACGGGDSEAHSTPRKAARHT